MAGRQVGSVGISVHSGTSWYRGGRYDHDNLY